MISSMSLNTRYIELSTDRAIEWFKKFKAVLVFTFKIGIRISSLFGFRQKPFFIRIFLICIHPFFWGELYCAGIFILLSAKSILY